jgi:FlaA1/EpsC-like NDP-sugar epimerase
MGEFQPQIVVHAAAYKHVPLLEINVTEGIRNNILGTRTVAKACVAQGVNTFVMVSTDKAVNPTNVMGATKRLAEIYCQNLQALGATRFITVRFGNVLGSVGSVVPLFREQIRSGGPVTVTHPDMKRYFMTIPEASQLVLQSAALGKGGELLVLDMGEPVKIVDLARDMIRLSGREESDIEIVFSGLRPGEKLYEELMYDTEELKDAGHEKIFLSQAHPVEIEWLDRRVDLLLTACSSQDERAAMRLLREIVPSYRPDPSIVTVMPAQGEGQSQSVGALQAADEAKKVG